MNIKTYLARFNWDEVKERIYAVNTEDVKAVLCKKKLSVDDFLVLLSPAAACFLEEMALMSQHITQNRFGKNIQLFMPLYLSNECQNICTYCGFSLDNKIKRKTLSHAEIVIEALTLKKMGIDHVLLVTGEANSTVHIDYFLKAIALLKSYFNTISGCCEIRRVITNCFVHFFVSYIQPFDLEINFLFRPSVLVRKIIEGISKINVALRSRYIIPN